MYSSNPRIVDIYNPYTWASIHMGSIYTNIVAAPSTASAFRSLSGSTLLREELLTFRRHLFAVAEDR